MTDSKMTTDRHQANPVTFRPGIKPGDPAGDRTWLYEHAPAVGKKPGTIMSELLAEYRARVEGTRESDSDSQKSTVPGR